MKKHFELNALITWSFNKMDSKTDRETLQTYGQNQFDKNISEAGQFLDT